ncbi:MAG: M61 family peptidase [Spirosomataceae bacterium]
MHSSRFYQALLSCLLVVVYIADAQNLIFEVSMEAPATQKFQVTLHYKVPKIQVIELKMPNWSPGYYQLMNYPKNVSNFRVTDKNGQALPWAHPNNTTWTIERGQAEAILISYEVLANRKFVANSYLDEERAYLVPTGVFMYPAGQLTSSAEVTILPGPKWKNIATGLDKVDGKPNTFTAPDFDTLYDSPFLIGNLEELPSFTVQGIPHRFIGYKLGSFDRQKFIDDLRKVVTEAAAIIGHIPYKHYTFIAIGPGQGGIEHSNSTTISFDGSGLNSPEGRIRMLNFLAHEYFHHYNVKRIRPLELGPFDYEKGNRTHLLWVSEGLTVYYEYLILRRAAITTEEQLLNSLRSNMTAFENKPGRLYQSLTQASYETWSDGPFGRTGDEFNKTISYYDKGPVMGLLLDFKIRNSTQNQKSLDDVMRALYQTYYLKEKRGFTESEFRTVCEQIAGEPLTDFFEYISTTKEINYAPYFAYAGLQVDTGLKLLPGAWVGISARMRNDSLVVSEVAYDSPAWQAGLRRNDILSEIDRQKPTPNTLQEVLSAKQPGEAIEVKGIKNQAAFQKVIPTQQKAERNFPITPLPHPTPLQEQIYRSWAKLP